jgi:signal transduction histidine kinase
VAHGGSLAVDSRAGEGAVFTLVLPAQDGHPQQRIPVRANP